MKSEIILKLADIFLKQAQISAFRPNPKHTLKMNTHTLIMSDADQLRLCWDKKDKMNILVYTPDGKFLGKLPVEQLGRSGKLNDKYIDYIVDHWKDELKLAIKQYGEDSEKVNDIVEILWIYDAEYTMRSYINGERLYPPHIAKQIKK